MTFTPTVPVRILRNRSFCFYSTSPNKPLLVSSRVSHVELCRQPIIQSTVKVSSDPRRPLAKPVFSLLLSHSQKTNVILLHHHPNVLTSSTFCHCILSPKVVCKDVFVWMDSMEAGRNRAAQLWHITRRRNVLKVHPTCLLFNLLFSLLKSFGLNPPFT